MACEEVREEESAGSPGVRWAPGVGANGDACRRRTHTRTHLEFSEIGRFLANDKIVKRNPKGFLKG